MVGITARRRRRLSRSEECPGTAITRGFHRSNQRRRLAAGVLSTTFRGRDSTCRVFCRSAGRDERALAKCLWMLAAKLAPVCHYCQLPACDFPRVTRMRGDSFPGLVKAENELEIRLGGDESFRGLFPTENGGSGLFPTTVCRRQRQSRLNELEPAFLDLAPHRGHVSNFLPGAIARG